MLCIWKILRDKKFDILLENILVTNKIMIKHIICLFVISSLTATLTLPPECNEFLLLDDITRNIDYEGDALYCDNDKKGKDGLYRMGNQ